MIAHCRTGLCPEADLEDVARRAAEAMRDRLYYRDYHRFDDKALWEPSWVYRDDEEMAAEVDAAVAAALESDE